MATTLEEALQQAVSPPDDEEEPIPREPLLDPTSDDEEEEPQGSDAHAADTLPEANTETSAAVQGPSLAAELGFQNPDTSSLPPFGPSLARELNAGSPDLDAAAAPPPAVASELGFQNPDTSSLPPFGPSLARELNAGSPDLDAAAAPPPAVASAPNPADAIRSRLNATMAPPSAKKTLLSELLAVAPTAIAAAKGGTFAGAGAAQGAVQAQQIAAQKQAASRGVLAAELKDELDRQERERQAIETTKENAAERLQQAQLITAGRSDVQGQKSATAENVATGKDATALQLGTQRANAAEAIGGLNADGTLNAKGQASVDTHQAQDELTKAKADLISNPNNPIFKANYAQKQTALDNATKALDANLGFRRESLNLQEDKTYNPQPTAQERGRADLASSASEQVDDMRSIIQKHPEVFGPIAGRTTELSQWLGSQDPDAQRFATAKAVAADHMTGAFGARGGAIIQQMENALGSFKNNPAAGLAALDQVQKAAKNLEAKGTPQPPGGSAAKPSLSDEIGPKDGDTKTFTSGPYKGKTGTFSKASGGYVVNP